MAVVDISNPAPYASGVDISMFIRTREQEGFIFYFGTDVDSAGGTAATLSGGDGGGGGGGVRQASYITGQLVQGNLVVNVFFDGKKEKFQVAMLALSSMYL